MSSPGIRCHILFISYWSIGDPLTISTVFPHLRLLSSLDDVQGIDFVSVQRDTNPKCENVQELPDIVRYFPVDVQKTAFDFLNKAISPNVINRHLLRLCQNYSYDLIICRGTMAGNFGVTLHQKTGLPFYVESFEPHAGYMIDSNTWSPYGLKYLYQRYFEEKQKKTAAGLMTVSGHYREKLKEEGVQAEKIKVTPCCVSPEHFTFDKEKRQQIRNRLGISEGNVVGIYVGKFGDIYYDKEAFQLFRDGFDYFGKRFFLLLLTPNDGAFVRRRFAEFGIPQEKTHVDLVPHQEVPGYLSAADFAFTTVRPSRHRKYCSPIKDGEYWANGLPVLIPPGIGDDSDIIRQEEAGVVIDFVNESQREREHAFAKLESLLQQNAIRTRVKNVAVKYRSFERVQDIYKSMIAQHLQSLKTE